MPCGSRGPGPGSRLSFRSPLETGFTLIELLVAILLLSLLLAGAWGGIHAATKAIRSGDQAIERVNRLRVTQAFLRRQISHTMPLPYAEEKGTGMPLMFEGKSDFMRFVAPMPGYLSRGGPYVQTLRLANSSGLLQLVFTDVMLNGFDLDRAGSGQVQPTLLLDGIAEAKFEYRGVDDQGALEDWTDEWEEEDRVPVMVRISMAMRPDSGMDWPTMVIPLMLDVGSRTHSVRRSRPIGRQPTPPAPPGRPTR
ncbi:MAG TPA: prepilin-type N-terminal cleavage/methylation domain-containing protein [Rhodanobacteraceae bacterium]|nr:prepilin-type N-terminal cleavage/methylation domain-containing protein [Rhodanobacteraceae bacterium]